jgi:membrane-associated protease RseP (regulator of RpoE activity)
VAARLLEGSHEAALTVALQKRSAPAHNIVGRMPAPQEGGLPGAILFGAHYDHLGFGDRGSLEPDSKAVHNGADDNASGTAALLEVARLLVGRAPELKRDVLFVAFSAEESGALGSTHAVRHPLPGARPEDLVAMVNFDMVGRLRDNQVSVLGGDSAAEWKDLVTPACEKAGVACAVSGDGYGPSDQSSYYGAGVPVLQFFTGVHSDYHKPSDDAATIHSIGIARVAAAAADVAVALSGRGERLTYKEVPAPPPSGDVRATGGSLGTVPDYAGDGRPGLLLAGVRAGGPAEKAGLKRGDLIVEVGGKPVRDVNDFMFILRGAEAGVETVIAVVRDGKRIELLATYGPARMR